MVDQGNINDFLGIHTQYGEIVLMQPHLISTILADLHLQQKNVLVRKTLALSTILLHKDPHGAPMQPKFNYRSVIGKLNFLETSTHLDLAYAAHQCDWFSADPKHSHADAVKRIR